MLNVSDILHNTGRDSPEKGPRQGSVKTLASDNFISLHTRFTLVVFYTKNSSALARLGPTKALLFSKIYQVSWHGVGTRINGFRWIRFGY